MIDFKELRNDEVRLVTGLLKSGENRVNNGWNDSFVLASCDRTGKLQVTIPMRNNNKQVFETDEGVLAQALQGIWGERIGKVKGGDFGREDLSLGQFVSLKNWILSEHFYLDAQWVLSDDSDVKRLLEFSGSVEDGYYWIIKGNTPQKRGVVNKWLDKLMKNGKENIK